MTCNMLLESSQQELQLCFKLHLDLRSAHKVMGLQSCKSPSWCNFETPIRESRERKAIWMWALWRGVEYIIRGKVVASPKFRPWWDLCVCCPWFVLAQKMFQLRTNHLVWVLCRPMWVSEVSQLFLVPSRQHASLPLKVLWAREHALTLLSSVVFYLDSHLSLSRSWECVNHNRNLVET